MARFWSLVDKRALLVTAICLVVWRLLNQISIIDTQALFIERRLELYSQPGFFALVGPNSVPFSAYSLASVGIGPYINALLIMNLLALVSRRTRSLVSDPDQRRVLHLSVRAIAVVLALGQAYGLTVLGQNVGALPGVLDWSARLIVCLQLAGGTAIMIMLADAIDEWGLGFGYGAWAIFILGYVATEVHRLAGGLATTPSVEALYLPLAIWAIFTVGVTVAAVAVLLAVRQLSFRRSDIDVRLLGTGVARPVMFAFAVIFLPTVYGNYYVTTNPDAGHWLTNNWSLLGPVVWLDVVYGALEAVLIIAFALFVSVADLAILPVPFQIVSHIQRLAVLGGAFLAIATVGVPVVVHVLTPWPERPIGVSGFDVVVVTTVILLVVRGIEGHRPVPPLTATPLGIP